MLKKLNISPQFHSQVTLGITAMLLLASVGVSKSLPEIAKSNYRDGEGLYEKGLLIKTKAKYEQVAQIDPENSHILIALGKIYESLGDIEQASKEYKGVLQLGNARAFNNLGRVYISQNKSAPAAESLLRMGLQRVRKDDFQLNYELHLNLGWVLLKQNNHQAAEKELKKAVSFDKLIPENQICGGMAYCFLVAILEKKLDTK
jgi:Tfp pilus assembly protein PilF